MLCSVNEHILGSIFSTRLARKRGHNLSDNFRAEVQAHLQSLWNVAPCFFLLLVGEIYMHILAHVPTYGVPYECVCVGVCEDRVNVKSIYPHFKSEICE